MVPTTPCPVPVPHPHAPRVHPPWCTTAESRASHRTTAVSVRMRVTRLLSFYTAVGGFRQFQTFLILEVLRGVGSGPDDADVLARRAASRATPLLRKGLRGIRN